MPREANNKGNLPLPYKILMRLEFFLISSPQDEICLCVHLTSCLLELCGTAGLSWPGVKLMSQVSIRAKLLSKFSQK